MIIRLQFWLLHILVYSLSKLPFWVLYRISDLGFFLVYRVFGYRREVVRHNLALSFPERAKEELLKIEKDYYHHLCDLIVETLKVYTISDRGLAERVRLSSTDVIAEVQARGKGSILLASHHGNFEWMHSRLDLYISGDLPTYAVYTPFRNAAFDRLMRRLRERRGVKMQAMYRAMSQAMRAMQEPCLFGMIADQSPHHGLKLYFTRFLNQATAFHTSFAKIALRMQTPLYFARMRKIKRGYYELQLHKIDPEPFLPANHSQILRLTDHYAALLAEDIEAQPAYWLWSHRRWKHQPREGDVLAADLGGAQKP
ncbi:MAG: lysophospholipid acyltransferase family protein [Bacteroidota bacterium]